MPDLSRDGPRRGQSLARISTELVRLHAKFYGRGPSNAKTHLVEDTVICILRGGFTTIEDTLIDSGYPDSVLQMRRDFQLAMEKEFRQVVEEATGREVIAYVSMVQVDPDLAVELFMLAPSPMEESADWDADVQTDGHTSPADGGPRSQSYPTQVRRLLGHQGDAGAEGLGRPGITPSQPAGSAASG